MLSLFSHCHISVYAFPLPRSLIIFSPYLLAPLSLNAAGGQTDAHKWSCQSVHCDDNDDEWHGWWLARLPGQIWPNIRQTAPVGYRTVAVQCVTKACWAYWPILGHQLSHYMLAHVNSPVYLVMTIYMIPQWFQFICNNLKSGFCNVRDKMHMHPVASLLDASS